jgi:hypothetical protein
MCEKIEYIPQTIHSFTFCQRTSCIFDLPNTSEERLFGNVVPHTGVNFWDKYIIIFQDNFITIYLFLYASPFVSYHIYLHDHWFPWRIALYFRTFLNHVSVWNTYRFWPTIAMHLIIWLHIKFSEYLMVRIVSQFSEWMLLNANSAIFQLHHGEKKLFFNEMMMRSALF